MSTPITHDSCLSSSADLPISSILHPSPRATMDCPNSLHRADLRFRLVVIAAVLPQGGVLRVFRHSTRLLRRLAIVLVGQN
jgi:hypothetical protein